jgi:hypothetical protein
MILFASGQEDKKTSACCPLLIYSQLILQKITSNIFSSLKELTA